MSDAGTTPTLAQVYDLLRDEYDALGLLSYHGNPNSADGTPWMADLALDDIQKLRALLLTAVAAIEGYA